MKQNYILLNLKESNPEGIVSAKIGQLFYREGERFYLVNDDGVLAKELYIPKRRFIGSASEFKYPNSDRKFHTFSSVPESYEVQFLRPREVWGKETDSGDNTGWRFQCVCNPFAVEILASPTPTPSPTVTLTPTLTVTPTPTTSLPPPTPTPTVTPSGTPFPGGFCSLNLNSSGGDAGYDVTYDVTGDFAGGGSVNVSFNAYIQKDRLILYANGVSISDSGCISGTYTPTVTIPSGTTTLRVRVIPNCEGGVGTSWTLAISCV